jgi:hypothetical protein
MRGTLALKLGVRVFFVTGWNMAQQVGVGTRVSLEENRKGP